MNYAHVFEDVKPIKNAFEKDVFLAFTKKTFKSIDNFIGTIL